MSSEMRSPPPAGLPPDPDSDSAAGVPADVALDPARPLILCDADEVLIEFARPLQAFLAERDLILDLASFALTGNIRRMSDGRPLEKGAVRQLIAAYFDECIAPVRPVDGAREAIARLARIGDVLVLSNVPEHLRAQREGAMRTAGLSLRVIANAGGKGPAVARLARARHAPVVFIDDLPPQHASVAEHAAHVHRIHFVADPRLARLIGPAEHCHRRIDRWDACVDYIEETIAVMSG